MTSPVRAADDAWAWMPAFIKAANSWHRGDAIPPRLERYQQSPGDLPEPTDSLNLISQVTNLDLLAGLVTDLTADRRCKEDAFEQGMYAGGPKTFFGVLAGDLKAIGGVSNPWLDEIRERLTQPHVVVDALFISDRDMPSRRVNTVLDTISHDLRAGQKWHEVYKMYADRFEIKGRHYTTIGNLGHLVVFADSALGRGHFVDTGDHTLTWTGEELPRRLFRLTFFDPEHLPILLHSSVRDIVRLHSAVYHEYVLYQIQEVYSGKQ